MLLVLPGLMLLQLLLLLLLLLLMLLRCASAYTSHGKQLLLNAKCSS